MATAKVWDAATSSWVEVLDTIQAIPQAIGTAAGSLVGFSASGTPVEIPAAAGDGYVLTSDASQPGKAAWAASQGLAAPRPSWHRQWRINGGTVATTGYPTCDSGTLAGAGVTAGYISPMYFDPADYAIDGYELEWRLCFSTHVNGTAVGATQTARWTRITTGSGAGSTMAHTAVADALTVANSSTAAGAGGVDRSAWTAADTAGSYAFRITNSATTAANSHVAGTIWVELRWVPS